MKPTEVVDRLGRWSTGRGPLYVLLAARLRRLIDDGDLPPGLTLPPDRALASALAVGRSTVVAAYDLLHSEGRIVRRQGSGTRVAGHHSGERPATTGAPVFLHLLDLEDDVIQLACAAPGAPPPELITAYERSLPRLAAITGDLGYHPAGHPVLRRALAERYRDRGVPTEPEQILITNGGQQALSLLARCFVRPGEQVLVEGPTYPGALEAFREEAAVLRALPLGLSGFETVARAHRPALAYVVPAFHNPTGTVLSTLSRLRLAESATALDVPLVADEVLAELAFPGEEVPPPFAANAGSVITVGSFSKIAWGGLRVGWIRADKAVIARLERVRAVYDLGGNIPAQLAAAELISELGTLCRRRSMERKARHDHLRAELARQLPGWLVEPARGGQTLWVRLPYGDGASFAQAALRNGVAVLPGGGLDISGGGEQHVRIHFMHPQHVLSEAVTRLASAWGDYRPPARGTNPPAVLAV